MKLVLKLIVAVAFGAAEIQPKDFATPINPTVPHAQTAELPRLLLVHSAGNTKDNEHPPRRSASTSCDHRNCARSRAAEACSATACKGQCKVSDLACAQACKSIHDPAAAQGSCHDDAPSAALHGAPCSAGKPVAICQANELHFLGDHHGGYAQGWLGPVNNRLQGFSNFLSPSVLLVGAAAVLRHKGQVPGFVAPVALLGSFFSAMAQCSYGSIDLRFKGLTSSTVQAALDAEIAKCGGADKVDSLDLSGNLLTSLPAGVFDRLTQLSILYLNGNSAGLACTPPNSTSSPGGCSYILGKPQTNSLRVYTDLGASSTGEYGYRIAVAGSASWGVVIYVSVGIGGFILFSIFGVCLWKKHKNKAICNRKHDQEYSPPLVPSSKFANVVAVAAEYDRDFESLPGWHSL